MRRYTARARDTGAVIAAGVIDGWTGRRYGMFRTLLGAYLFVHFATLLPWGTELFSHDGVLPQAQASPLLRLFPNVLALSDAPATVGVLLATAMAAATAFTVGWRDRIAAIILWYVLACVFGRNPLIANPSLPFIGWMLLAHAALPPAPALSWDRRGRAAPDDWHMPAAIFAAAWIVMSVGYTYSGWTKLISPSWIDGTAIARVLANPLARDTSLRTFLLELPAPIHAAMTWGALALEVLFAPLALSARLRPLIWSAMLMMHVGLMTLIDFAELSVGMVLLHLFTFDPRWMMRGR